MKNKQSQLTPLQMFDKFVMIMSAFLVILSISVIFITVEIKEYVMASVAALMIVLILGLNIKLDSKRK